MVTVRQQGAGDAPVAGSIGRAAAQDGGAFVQRDGGARLGRAAEGRGVVAGDVVRVGTTGIGSGFQVRGRGRGGAVVQVEGDTGGGHVARIISVGDGDGVGAIRGGGDVAGCRGTSIDAVGARDVTGRGTERQTGIAGDEVAVGAGVGGERHRGGVQRSIQVQGIPCAGGGEAAGVGGDDGDGDGAVIQSGQVCLSRRCAGAEIDFDRIETVIREGHHGRRVAIQAGHGEGHVGLLAGVDDGFGHHDGEVATVIGGAVDDDVSLCRGCHCGGVAGVTAVADQEEGLSNGVGDLFHADQGVSAFTSRAYGPARLVTGGIGVDIRDTVEGTGVQRAVEASRIGTAATHDEVIAATPFVDAVAVLRPTVVAAEAVGAGSAQYRLAVRAIRVDGKRRHIGRVGVAGQAKFSFRVDTNVDGADSDLGPLRQAEVVAGDGQAVGIVHVDVVAVIREGVVRDRRVVNAWVQVHARRPTGNGVAGHLQVGRVLPVGGDDASQLGLGAVAGVNDVVGNGDVGMSAIDEHAGTLGTIIQATAHDCHAVDGHAVGGDFKSAGEAGFGYARSVVRNTGVGTEDADILVHRYDLGVGPGAHTDFVARVGDIDGHLDGHAGFDDPVAVWGFECGKCFLWSGQDGQEGVCLGLAGKIAGPSGG